MREADEGRRYHQPAAARRHDGVRALARQAFDRAPAERRPAAAEGTVDVDAEYRQVVRGPLAYYGRASGGRRRFLAAPGKRLYMSPRLLTALSAPFV